MIRSRSTSTHHGHEIAVSKIAVAPVPVRLTAILHLAAILCMVAGCATNQPLILHEAVGPLAPPVTSSSSEGRLIVYSATRVTTADQSEYPVHTPYTVYGSGDKVVRRVTNTAGLYSQSPAAVSLPQGEYHVKALAAGSGYVVMPVVIVAGKTTIVDLDGTALPQDTDASVESGGAAQWVRLPDGRVVGSRAPCNGSGCN
jgi:hypothetical protein